MSSFAKPENALQRANELVAVGQSQTALQTLHDVITAKRHRTWQQTMESIMLRYVELCVELQKGKMAKDGLIQYRMSCQHVNIASLEAVIAHLLQKAEDALATAKEQAGVEMLPDDDVTPESLVAALTAGSECSTDKTQVEKVLPWMKFLWEAYRTVLEILKNNAKLEAVYQATAQRALKYCLKYTRTTEFKRLCDILRSHLANLNKAGQHNQQQNISLANPETVHFMIETRFVQLDVACQLELWQEAFRSIEDIHSLMQITRKPLKKEMVRLYFERLATIFWASENHLLHAHALFKLYEKSCALKISQEELVPIASKLLVATLCVPRHENRKASAQYYDFDIDRDRGLRLSSLLGVTTSLDCKVLLQELVARGLPTIVNEEVSELHTLLLTELDPLQLCERARPVLEKLEGSYPEYIPALKKTICVQLLGQLGEVYQAMQISSLEQLAHGIVDMQEMEQLIVEAVRNNQVQVRLDFQTKTLRFGADSIQYDDIRWQLSTLNSNLKEAIYLIQPDLKKEEEESVQRHLQMLSNELRGEHDRVLARKNEIEERKEQHEKELQRREKEEQLRKAEREEQEAIKERARLAQEAERREEARRAKEDQDREREEAAVQAARIAAMGGTDKSLEELKNMSTQALEAEQRRSINKQREEREHKLSIAAKRLDYIERARRILEKPALERAIEERRQNDRQYFEEHQAKKAEEQHNEWKESLDIKGRLAQTVTDTDAYMQQLVGARQSAFQQLLAQRQEEWEANCEQERQDRRQRRREEKARRKAEAERQAQAEADRKEREERERAEEEERRADAEARMAERAEREAALNAQADIQRRREQEIMDKQAASRGGDRDEGPTQGRWAGGRPSGSSWRDREAAREPEQGGRGRWGGDRGDREDSDRGSRWGGDRGGDRWGSDRGDDRREGGSRWGDRGGDRFGDRGGDRFGDRGGDRFGDRGGDRGGDRFGDRGGDRGGDRFGDRGGDRFGDRGGDRFGDRGGDRGGSGRWERGGGDRDRGEERGEERRWGGRDDRNEERGGDRPSEGRWQPRQREDRDRSGPPSEGGWRTAR